MDKPRITETDIRIIDEWLTEVAKDPSIAFISHTSDETRIIAMMIMQLLKEQEAVEPILVREGWNKHHNNYVCPRCDNDVFYEQNYCTECGVQFLWEGR